jgi:hypothetical protein
MFFLPCKTCELRGGLNHPCIIYRASLLGIVLTKVLFLFYSLSRAHLIRCASQLLNSVKRNSLADVAEELNDGANLEYTDRVRHAVRSLL